MCLPIQYADVSGSRARQQRLRLERSANFIESPGPPALRRPTVERRLPMAAVEQLSQANILNWREHAW
jgi:hypothetical protein